LPVTRRTAIATAAGTIAALVTALMPVLWMGTGPDAWLLSARYTARLAFCLFLIAFLAPVWFPGFGEAGKRDAYLAFASAHGIHLGALITYRALIGDAPDAVTVAAGGLAYGLGAVLAVAYILGQTWRRFETATLHYVLLIFALTYASRIPVEETRMLGVAGVIVSGVALLLRHTRRFGPAQG